MISKSDLQKLTDINIKYTYFDPALPHLICGWKPGAKRDFVLIWLAPTSKYALSIGPWQSKLDNMDQVIKYILLYYSVFG